MLFEKIMNETEGNLVNYLKTFSNSQIFHFSKKFLDIYPLQIAFPWIFYCFIGVLDVDQVFCVFDRILGSKSLEILAILSVAIISNKQTTILKSQKYHDVLAIFDDLIEENVNDNLKQYLERKKYRI